MKKNLGLEYNKKKIFFCGGATTYCAIQGCITQMGGFSSHLSIEIGGFL